MDDPSQGLCDEQQPCSNYSGTFSCTTFNILAPIYKRLTAEVRESKDYDLWLSRNDDILNRLMELKSSIICLQEFWIENEELVKLYERRLGQAGYVTYKCARTNNRGDVSQNHVRVLNYKECLYNDISDRVAQLLHVELLVHPRNQSSLDIRTEALVMNTHLIFPHDSRYCFIRLQEVFKMLQFIESYCHEYKLAPLPVILCGDWNGSKKGNVCKFLKSQGFISSYDSIRDPSHTGEEGLEWVSHRNHRGNLCAVDFIWLLDPNICRKPLKWSYMEAFLGNVNKLRCNVPNKGVASLPFLKCGGSSITYSQFSRALAEIDQLGIKGHPQINLTDEDMREFWEHIGIDEDGTIDLSLFAEECKSEIAEQTEVARDTTTSEILCGFDVSKATLFPPEVERGIWSEKYSLSDHACLTVEFSVVQL